MFRLLKKTFAVCLIGFGLRYFDGIITSCNLVAFYNWHSYHCCRFYLACKLDGKRCENKVKVVVKRPPRFLRGFIKFIFGIKNT